MALQDVNHLLKDFDKTRKMVKKMMRGGGKKGARMQMPPGMGL